MKIEISEAEAKFILSALDKAPAKGLRKFQMVVDLAAKFRGEDVTYPFVPTEAITVPESLVKNANSIHDEIKAQQAAGLAQKKAAQERAKTNTKVKKYEVGGVKYEEEEI